MKFFYKIIKIFGLTLLGYYTILGQDENSIIINNLESGELRFAAFEIFEPTTLGIAGKAGNFGGRFSNNQAYYGWIINSETREVIWDARESFNFGDRSGMFEFDDFEPLDKGFYEVYYAGSSINYNVDIKGFSELFSKLFSGSGKSKFKKKYQSELGITLTGDADKFKEIDADKLLKQTIESSILSINRVGDFEEIEAGFALKDETTIRIYTIGEGRDGNLYDLAWISDASGYNIVWEASLDESEHAGGGKKNYVIDDDITLPEGSYLLHYSTDDSHSYEGWNVMPPNDPQFWGITIWPESPDDAENIAEFKETDITKPMIDMTRVGNDEYRSQGFSLPKDSKIKIYCLGEGYERDEMADYGWIINANTKEVVWTMNNNPNLENAGGAEKNRRVSETKQLKKGDYIAYYITDDSHSFEEWNSGIPFNKTKWGLTIWTDGNDYKLFNAEEYKSRNIIVEIVKVGDDEKIGKSFSMPRDGEIRIYAIGEGGRSGMDDYGWIEDDDGDVVWEMEYDETQNAGGASKNRLVNETISLDAGKYKLYFVTDGSHSYEYWNSMPPTNQDSYGITLFKVN